ncbi:hypothetical protein H2203_002864 [Taxawa tesnikishii (nom. ined.)]|nr:hypothetical protein H2203_002864 [Dothideales sp. JES 119]
MSQPLLPTAAKPASADSAPFSFLDLPGELRNRIHKLVVAQDTTSICAYLPVPEFASQPAWTNTNRQIRNESLGMFYSSNGFTPCQHCARPRSDSNKEPDDMRLRACISAVRQWWNEVTPENREAVKAAPLFDEVANRPKARCLILNTVPEVQ